MADSSLSDTAKQEKAKEIRHAAMEQARSVLTPEQREQLKANAAHAASNARNPRRCEQ